MQVRSTRRQFLKQVAVVGGATAFSAASWSRVYGANERLQVASIGTGGKGWDDLNQVAKSPHVNIVAICDIDESEPHLGRAATKFSQATRFTDWRRLLDDPKAFEAVIVSTPDFMHAPIGLAAMQLGKHLFCQKPLTHTVFEARQMQQAARKARVVTQMGNQIQSHRAYRTAVRTVHDGTIGKVKEVHSWQSDKLGWLLEEDRPAGADPIPSTLHWNDWLGVAPERPYKAKIYHPFNWRGWQDFSNGQLGDFGCHILDPVCMALELTPPRTIRADAPPMNREVWTKWSTVTYEFPGTKRTAGDTLKLTWYDGDGKSPPREALGLPGDYALPASGSVLIGEKGTLVIPHVAQPQLFPSDAFSGFAWPELGDVDHYVQWADACRGAGETTSKFDYSAPLTETVLLGTIAIRLPRQTLTWNAAELKTDNASANALLTKSYRTGWEPKWVT